MDHTGCTMRLQVFLRTDCRERPYRHTVCLLGLGLCQHRNRAQGFESLHLSGRRLLVLIRRSSAPPGSWTVTALAAKSKQTLLQGRGMWRGLSMGRVSWCPLGCRLRYCRSLTAHNIVRSVRSGALEIRSSMSSTSSGKSMSEDRSPSTSHGPMLIRHVKP
jgi:hypothetical protein